MRAYATTLLCLTVLAALARADDEAAAAVDGTAPAVDPDAPPTYPDGFVDPRNLPPPEPTADHLEMARILREMQHQESCHSAFGTPIGESLGVPAYSNCRDTHTSHEDHVYTHADKSGVHTVTTGMKWQCVEYARRFLLVMHSVLFGDVMGAVDIWRLTSGYEFHDQNQRVHLGRYRNFDDADRHPEVGSMVVWPIQPDMPFGHVGIVVELLLLPDEDRDAINEFAPHEYKHKRVAKVRVAEQNYHNSHWEAKNYTRELWLETLDGEYFGLVDPDGYKCFGWMTVEKFIKPLDYLIHPDDPRDTGLPKAAPVHELRQAAVHATAKNGGLVDKDGNPVKGKDIADVVAREEEL